MRRSALACLVACSFLFTVKDSLAAVIFSSSASAPSTDAWDQFYFGGPGNQHNTEDYTDNAGPPGQSFTTPNLPGVFLLNAVGMKGRGDQGDALGSNWGVRISSITGTVMSPLLQNTAVATAGTGASDWILMSFSGLDQLTLLPNTTYAFQFYSDSGYYGFENSDGAVGSYVGGDGINGATGNRNFSSNVAAIRGYDRTFFADLELVAIPEPSTMVFSILGGLGFACFTNRRAQYKS